MLMLIPSARHAAMAGSPCRAAGILTRREKGGERAETLARVLQAVATEVAIASPRRARVLANSIELTGFRDTALLEDDRKTTINDHWQIVSL